MVAEYVYCSLASPKKIYSYDNQLKKMDSYDATKLPRGHMILL